MNQGIWSWRGKDNWTSLKQIAWDAKYFPWELKLQRQVILCGEVQEGRMWWTTLVRGWVRDKEACCLITFAFKSETRVGSVIYCFHSVLGCRLFSKKQAGRTELSLANVFQRCFWMFLSFRKLNWPMTLSSVQNLNLSGLQSCAERAWQCHQDVAVD